MDFNVHFDEEYRNTLQEIQNYFQETLTTHIEDDTRRYKSRKISPKTFHDVGFVDAEKRILLKNITLPTRPDLLFEKFQVDFKNQCMYTSFKFEGVQVSTDYELSSLCDGEVSTRSGGVKFDFPLTVSGQVGIFFTEDSFSPKTYDLRYDIGDLQVKFTPEENLELFNLDVKNTQPVERKLMSLFWPELRDYLYYEIYRIISGNVVEFSVSELLIDEPEHLKKYAVERIAHGNVYIDQCLNELNSIIEKQSGFKSTEVFLLKLGDDKEFKCKEAKLLQSSLKRVYDTSYVNDGNDQYYCTHVNIEQLQYGFLNSVLKAENESFEGDVIVKPYRNKILLKVVMSDGRKRLSVEIIDILDWEFEVKPKNDVIQKFVEGDLRPYIIGYVWYHTNKVLQKYVDEFNTEV